MRRHSAASLAMLAAAMLGSTPSAPRVAERIVDDETDHLRVRKVLRNKPYQKKTPSGQRDSARIEKAEAKRARKRAARLQQA